MKQRIANMTRGELAIELQDALGLLEQERADARHNKEQIVTPAQLFCCKCGKLTDYPNLLLFPGTLVSCEHCKQVWRIKIERHK